MLPEAALVNGSDLLQKDHRILAQPHAASGDVDVGRQLCLAGLAGDGGGDDRGGMAVAGIVLDDENRPGASLFAAHHRGQICIENVAPSDCAVHTHHSPWFLNRTR